MNSVVKTLRSIFTNIKIIGGLLGHHNNNWSAGWQLPGLLFIWICSRYRVEGQPHIGCIEQRIQEHDGGDPVCYIDLADHWNNCLSIVS